MFFPISRADPAELVLAESTYHVITTSRLFNTTWAHRAIFRLCSDVISCFRVVRAFLQPDFDRWAFSRVMKIQAALEAEFSSTRLALELLHKEKVYFLTYPNSFGRRFFQCHDNLRAIGARTKAHSRITYHHAIEKYLLKFLPQRSWHERQHGWFSEQNFTAVARVMKKWWIVGGLARFAPRAPLRLSGVSVKSTVSPWIGDPHSTRGSTGARGWWKKSIFFTKVCSTDINLTETNNDDYHCQRRPAEYLLYPHLIIIR